MMQVPLIGFIGRLDYQKGADLVLGAAPWLLNQDVQIVCLGTGDKHLEVMSVRGHLILSTATTGFSACLYCCLCRLAQMLLPSTQDFLTDTNFGWRAL